MKVKELAEIFREDIEELIKLLDNVGVKADAETNINKDVEKKLAKRYNVPYPFKKSKPKVDQKQTEKPQPTPQPQQPVKPQRSSEKQSTKPSKPAPQPTSKPAPKATKPESSKPEPKQPKVETKKPVTRPKFEDDIVVPKVDEETLRKYEHFLEDDEYNITREKGKKKGAQDRSADTGEYRRRNVKIKRNKNERRTSNVPKAQEFDQKTIYYEKGMTTIEVAEALGISVTELVKKLFLSLQVMATATQILDRDIIELVAMEYGFEVKDKVFTDLTRFEKIEIIDDEEELVSRPPVVTIMGHVDHGKTTLLDTIRHSRVVKGEAGGITQHIGAYQVKHNDQKITFLDTPGHEAFTAMRARGADVTDVAIIVVAANDGVKPQTIEAIDHARAAGVTMIIAINKMDLPEANIDRTIANLLEQNVFLEGWGGEVLWTKTSARTGEGIDELLELILLSCEMKELKAKYDIPGKGVVIESRKDTRMGTMATILIQEGTIGKGDNIICGATYGHVRKMINEREQEILQVGPSDICVLFGLNDVPKAGDVLNKVRNERIARQISSERLLIRQEREKYHTTTTLNNLFAKIKENQMTELRLIVKADTDGSVEAICDALQKLSTDEVVIHIIRKSVGGIIEADVNLASASNAIILGFHVRANGKVKKLAEDMDVEIKLYSIIFDAIDDVKSAMSGMLAPEIREKFVGHALIKQTFKVKKLGTIAGCLVKKALF